MTCDEFFEILQREAPIDPTTQAALDVHASACDECVRVAEGLAAWREAEAHPERFPESPPWILESLHRRLDAMEREKALAARRLRLRRLRRLLLAGVAAVSLALLVGVLARARIYVQGARSLQAST